MTRSNWFPLVLCLLTVNSTRGEISFSREVRPILSDKCFACHGPDVKTREAGLRLDTQEGALEEREGVRAFAPGDLAESEAIRRILTEDPGDRMPPEKAHKPLTSDEIETLKRWVEAGAPWERHWAYGSLERPEVPAVANVQFVRNPIDQFVLKAQMAGELAPSPEADRVTLVRRLYLDLLGLPPSSAQVKAFVSNKSPQPYEDLVEELLESKHYGERMAVYWLDLVRYADTIGYHSDNAMEVSAYRDYVIEAFNRNLPFDEFTMEQLAGDLMFEPSASQRIASGYNRLLQTTEEGGAQPKEYMAIYAADRVRNVSEVWLGSTLGCAQCHDHKFDPFTMKDFYSMAAFFGDIKEIAVGKRQPNMRLATPEQEKKISELKRKLEEYRLAKVLERDADLAKKVAAGQADWEKHQLAKLNDLKAPKEVKEALGISKEDRKPEQTKRLRDHYLTLAPDLEKARAQLKSWQTELSNVEKSVKTMLVAESLAQPRGMRVLPRGNWLDDSGDEVRPAVPAFLANRAYDDEMTLNRLDLARWIVSQDNPLTARTFVNRLWKLFFGEGLSKVLNDLGGQGQPPTHPELLDWLAAEFQTSGWDVKHMVRLMVNSGTYRQQSQTTPAMRRSDPGNRWWTRQGRWRLDAEFVRDTALVVSGLFVDQLGGRSVKPYQPAGYWQHLNFPQRKWQAGEGEELYRRGLYTFWCRSFLHPAMLAFDAPSREECTAERPRSNTPQQALVLLNDPQFVEAAREFGRGIAAQAGDEKSKITWAWTRATSRAPSSSELSVLNNLYAAERKRFERDATAADELLEMEKASLPDDVNKADLAAWTQVARTILNAYETTSRS